jgi:RNA polymerase sigma-70 factor, ECF subfamily
VLASGGIILMKSVERRQLEDVADRDVVSRVLDGERNAFALIVSRHHVALYRLAWRIVGNAALAEELTQEAFARAYERLGSYRGEAPFKPWLFRILANLCKDAAKSAQRRERPSADPTADGVLAQVPAGAGAESRMDQRRALEALSSAIRALPDGQREAFVLRLLENQSYEEVSETLGVPVGALKVRVHRARERLKEALGPLLDSILPEEAA